MISKVLNFFSRPFVGEDTTARLAYQRYNLPLLEGVNGGAGFTVMGQVNATYPAGIAPGPTHKINDPSATGNQVDIAPVLQPLSDDRSF